MVALKYWQGRTYLWRKEVGIKMEAKIHKLLDYIKLSIKCDNCSMVEEDYTIDYYFAEQLKEIGWRVTKSDHVLCPNCKRYKPKREK